MSIQPSGHHIRLRGPWKFHRLDDAGRAQTAEGTLRHPEDWSQQFGRQAGRCLLSRTFHSPTNLDPDEKIFIVLTGVHGTGEVRLNGHRIGTFGPHETIYEFACPLPLPFTNRLEIDVAFSAATQTEPPMGLYDAVELLIRTESPDDPTGESTPS